MRLDVVVAGCGCEAPGNPCPVVEAEGAPEVDRNGGSGQVVRQVGRADHVNLERTKIITSREIRIDQNFSLNFLDLPIISQYHKRPRMTIDLHQPVSF